MKRFYLFLTMLIAAFAISAQVSMPNYIRTRRMLNDTGSSYLDHIAYYDGLGRPCQTLQKAVENNSLTGNRLSTLQEYDALGRPSNSWLPISTTSDYVSPSSFKASAPGNYSGDSSPYTRLVYETSPLERILQQYDPGAAWSTHPVSNEYLLNTSSSPLNCTAYSVNSTDALVKGSIYANGQLNVTQSTDEDGNTGYTFIDKLGRTLLVRQMKGGEAHDTYYVYDDFGNLCFVLQPMYQISGNLDLHAFQYKYNSHNQCIWKKLPGVQYVDYVYDAADRLTFSQDGKQRAAGKWMFYEYDAVNRLTRQGECTGQNATSSPVVLVQNYYDSYPFLSQTGFNNGNFYGGSATIAKGKLTGSIVSVPGSSEQLYMAYYYDIQGHLTKSVRSNLLGGYETTSTVYSFSGQPSTVSHVHTASGNTTRTEVYTYTYDHADRVSKVEHTLNGTKVTLADNTYDNLGRLSGKSLHGSATNKLAYAYNIRSWLTGITGAKFTQNLYYADGNNAVKCYNGNISSMTWKAGDEATVRGYKLTYDGLSRLATASYGETTAISTNLDCFTEKVSGYDKNGNITALQRYGQTSASAYGLIDNLSYTLNGNQLNRVDDAVTASAYNGGFEFKDAVKQAGEYTYDANGNLTKDLNKNITGIQYNVLNLPSSITFSDGSTITYLYSADGTKLRTTHKIETTTTTTDYCGNVIYENGIAKQLLTEEGYVSLSDNKYYYYLKDHQGNNRVVINQTGAVEETNHYYPFGGVFAGTGNVQPFKYNGKEYDAKKGLNWYDYGARHYDAVLGRFTTVDPLAEKYYGINPYAYCLNNPVKYIDIDGMKPRIYIEINGVGHTFVTTGEGKNTIVYTYGRYGALNGEKSSARSLSRNGEGVLVIMKGNDAISYIKNEVLNKEARIYEVTNGADDKIDAHFNKIFNASDKKPSVGKYKNTNNAKVIDTYDLWNNNCTTKSVEAIAIGTNGDFILDSSSPSNIDTQLYYENRKQDSQVKKIDINKINEEYRIYEQKK